MCKKSKPCKLLFNREFQGYILKSWPKSDCRERDSQSLPFDYHDVAKFSMMPNVMGFNDLHCHLFLKNDVKSHHIEI